MRLATFERNAANSEDKQYTSTQILEEDWDLH